MVNRTHRAWGCEGYRLAHLVTDPDTLEEYELTLEISYHHDPGFYSGLPENCYPEEESFEFEVVDEGGATQAALDTLEEDVVYTAFREDVSDWRNAI